MEKQEARSQERREDERLAAYTDRLLSGLPVEDRPPLADVVELLARTLRWEDVPAEVRVSLRRRLAMEWEKQRRRSVLGILRAPQRRLLWATAGLLLGGALTVVLLTSLAPPGLAATAVSTAGGKILVVLGVAALLLLAIGLLRRS